MGLRRYIRDTKNSRCSYYLARPENTGRFPAGSESRCSQSTHAERIVSDFRRHKLFTLDTVFVHIHHK